MKYWSYEQFRQWLEWSHHVQLTKSNSASDRREGIMDGNKIRTVFYNYGSIGRPNTEPSIEWPKGSHHGYAYEFGPIIGAQVVDVHGDTIPVFSDALIDGGDRAPSGKVWGWQPLPQALNSAASTPAMSNDPSTWPQRQDVDNPFYNPNATSDKDRFLWPGVDDTLGHISADLESYWVMDDRDNDEFEYYPFINDSSRRGLGVQLNCRLMQFSASLAEDILFYIIEIKNVSDKPLDKVVVGMFGDPHIGGPGDFSDDFAGFEKDINMVYSWDAEGSGNDYGIPWTDLGWLGFKFLESPVDGNGNQLGLTSMSAPVYASTGGSPSLDDIMWENLRPGQFTGIKQNSDNVFLFGSGYFSLQPGQSQRFSVAILLGQGKDDLFANAEIAQEIYDLNYKFTKAPNPPKVTAVPGDGKVTLYWDTEAERSYDDFFKAYDFEGYKVYRSTNGGQTWGQPITDADGNVRHYKPLTQYDRIDGKKGYFPKEQYGTHFNLGKDTGLKHTFIDSNLINGVTYSYAVTAYDSGYATLGVQPAESNIVSSVNMIDVKPIAKAAGYQDAAIAVEHLPGGFSTGSMEFSVLDPMVVKDNSYDIKFNDSGNNVRVNIINEQSGDTVIADSPKINGEPLMFDGLIGSINNEKEIKVVDEKTGWSAGSKTTIRGETTLFAGGIRYPRDLEIRFFDQPVDTSLFFNTIVKFQVWNINENKKIKFIFLDKDHSADLSPGDEIVPAVTVEGSSQPKATWQIKLLAPATGDTILPAAGDVYQIFVTKPFEAIDSYKLTTSAAKTDDKQIKEHDLDKITVVPNPYVVSSSFEVPPPSVFSAGRGERRLYFMHLPSKCVIRIYTLNGELIKTIEHNTSIFDGSEPWDLVTYEGLEIAYGIYVYHVDAGNLGTKIGKFAVIK